MSSWLRFAGAVIVEMPAPEPSLLDWVSGVAVPLMIGGATLWVALWAGRIARDSNALMERHHREVFEEQQRLAREELVRVLGRMSGDTLAREMAGTGADAMTIALQKWGDDLLAAQGKVSGDEARRITRWVSVLMTRTKGQQGDFDNWMERVTVIQETLRLWIRDPEAGIEHGKAELVRLGIDDSMDDDF